MKMALQTPAKKKSKKGTSDADDKPCDETRRWCVEHAVVDLTWNSYVMFSKIIVQVDTNKVIHSYLSN